MAVRYDVEMPFATLNGSPMRRGPRFVSSGDLTADRRYGWALDYLAQGDLAAAADILRQALELAPNFAAGWFALGSVRERQGDRNGAVEAFRAAAEADAEDLHAARLHLARLGAGAATDDMMANHARRVFDQHAPDFDESLLRQLGYRGPDLLLAAVLNAAAEAGRPPRFAAALDLGCGTGLSGAPFRPHVERLVGVDLSAGMIEEARRKTIYNRLETDDLVCFLAVEAAADTEYDLVIAADVFVYVADLTPVMQGVASVLAPNGLFAFTLETHGGDGVLLRETLRYAHGASQAREAVTGAELRLLQLAEVSTRTEKGEPVPGLLVVAGS
jgi:predicted TPR repeat methyltransferase